MALLTRDQILSADDIATEDVDVPEWGGTVRVRTLSGTERDAFETKMADKDADRSNIRASLAAAAMVGDGGQQLFTKRDVVKLGLKSAKALDRVWDVATRLAGITQSDAEQKEREDELDEDFDGTPDEPSTTD